ESLRDALDARPRLGGVGKLVLLDLAVELPRSLDANEGGSIVSQLPLRLVGPADTIVEVARTLTRLLDSLLELVGVLALDRLLGLERVRCALPTQVSEAAQGGEDVLAVLGAAAISFFATLVNP